MKKFALILALVLSVSLGLAQDYIYVNPSISSTTVTYCTTYVSSTVVMHGDSGFLSIYAGQKVYGVGVPYGTTVAYSDSVDSLVLSAAVTQGGVKSLQFGVFEGTDYVTGDWVGMPFRVYSYPGDGGGRLLTSIQMVDAADSLDDMDVVLFSSFSDTLGLDNAAASVVASEYAKVIGIVSLTTQTDLGAMRTMSSNGLSIVIPKEGLFGRLIARSAYAPAAITNLRIRFGLW